MTDVLNAFLSASHCIVSARCLAQFRGLHDAMLDKLPYISLVDLTFAALQDESFSRDTTRHCFMNVHGLRHASGNLDLISIESYPTRKQLVSTL